MFNRKDPKRNAFMLDGPFYKNGYDWWWHSFTGISEKTGKEKPFFVEFFAINPGRNEGEAVCGQLPANKKAGRKPTYLMVKAGCWGEGKMQLHRFFSWDEVSMKAAAPYAVAVADCYASEEELRGSISISKEEAAAHPEWMCDSGEMSWDLELDKQIAYNVGYGASTPLRFLKAFEMYWHVEGMKTAFKGTVTVNGETYRISPENCYGYSDKNWGSNFTSPWVWLSSNHLYSRRMKKILENSAFDIGGGRPKIYFFPLERKLLGGFYYEGHEFEFNFSKFWTGSKTEFSSDETENEIQWHVKQENFWAIMETEIRCRKEDMLLVNYESPDGAKRHNRLWNGGNGFGTIRLYRKTGGKKKLIDVINVSNVGCEYGEYC